MRVCVSFKSPLLWFWLFCLLPPMAQAGCCNAYIKQAGLARESNGYLLSAEIDYQLSEKAMEALQNGVPLFWNIQVKIQRPREFFWPETLAEATIRYRLQYHALLKMYRVKNERNGVVHNVSTLSGAIGLMSVLRNVRLFDGAEFLPEPGAVVALKVDFDRDALPLPLRPLAYLSRQWYLSSDWSSWPLKN
ncbi:MAG: DUF4390 domain-containing protein [Methylobacter sp.]|uniref:DUF4390 domain-containing protein n=1 Tax=Methylovulum miyakonense TaxID=645578 RepID=UPI000360F8B0|nr:DUF4390 domain-containing protein [Methylovulum miyakonense]PPD44947.1 MAG: DUF4390 domain-containing protein [Methylobacter sp.]